MTRTEIMYELDGIQYTIKVMCSRLSNLVNQSCVNPSFRTRIHNANDKISDMSDHIYFAKLILNDLICEDSIKDSAEDSTEE